MNRKLMCVAAAIAAAFAIAGCGQTNGDGGIKMDVGVANLLDNQHFCFTWALYQEAPGGWTLIDQENDPICAADGMDTADSIASCYDGRKFIVAYEVTYYDENGQIGTATGTSGGGENDVCVKNADVPTSVLFQFRNEGNAGGADLYVNIDQICTNDKLVFDNDRVISAVWVQPDECTEGEPDSYCVLGAGCGLETVRYGITADGLTRFLFNESAQDDSLAWKLFYLYFEPVVPMDTLVLQHSPYVLHHEYSMGALERAELNAGVVFRYDSAAGISIGFVKLEGDKLKIIFDLDGTCNAGIDMDAQEQELTAPCPGMLLGAIPAGGSDFTLVMQCNSGGFAFVGCDATADPVCGP
jgi:hypothetical protein